MKRIITLIFLFMLTLGLASCGKKKNYKPTFQLAEGVYDSDKTISSLKIINVPSEPIEIGYFSSSNIMLEAKYTDGTKAYVNLDEGHFSTSQLEEFKTPGKKSFDFVYRNNHLPLKFELVNPKTPAVFKVEFKDKDGNVLDTQMVQYLSTAKYKGNKNIDYVENNKYYKYVDKWDKDISHVYKNISTKPVYQECLIENSSDKYFNNDRFYDIPAVKSLGSTYKALVYVGRINNATLMTSNVVNRRHYTDTSLVFDNPNYTRLEFVSEIADNLKNNILLNNYYHEALEPYDPRCVMLNSCLLNFNLSLSSRYDLDSGSLNMPSVFLREFSDDGFNTSQMEEISRTTSYKSVLNHMNVEPYNLYMDNSKFTYNVNEDYPLGNYKMCLLSDLDIYLDLEFSMTYNSGAETYTLIDAKICAAYNPDTLRVEYLHTDTEFNSYSNQFVISNRWLAASLYVKYIR